MQRGSNQSVSSSACQGMLVTSIASVVGSQLAALGAALHLSVSVKGVA
jgi:uncharacterized membrane protein